MGQPKRPEPQLLQIPGAEDVGVSYLTNLLKQPPPQAPQINIPPPPRAPQLHSIVMPLLEVAGMTPTELQIQNMLQSWLQTSPTESKAYQLGLGEIEKTLGEFYDPRTSDYWKGYRELSEMEQEKGVADIRRRQQLGGGLYSEPGMRQESEYIRGVGAERTRHLGELYERERDRMTAAVAQALGYAGFEEASAATRLQLGSTIGAIPREIEQMRNLAAYQQALGTKQSAWETQLAQAQLQQQANLAGYQGGLQQALAQAQLNMQSQMIPYQYGSQIAQTLMPQWYIDTSQPPNPLAGILGITTALAGIGK